MDSLPNEIIELVIKKAVGGGLYERTVSKLSMINKTFHLLSIPLLYTNIILDSDSKAIAFLNSHPLYQRKQRDNDEEDEEEMITPFIYQTKRLSICGNVSAITTAEVLEVISLKSELQRLKICTIKSTFDMSVLKHDRFKSLTYLELDCLVACPGSLSPYPFSLKRLHVLNHAILCACVVDTLIVKESKLIDLIAFPKHNPTQLFIGNHLDRAKKCQKLAFTVNSRTPSELPLIKPEYFTSAFKTDNLAIARFFSLIRSLNGPKFKGLDCTVYGELTPTILDKIMPLASILMEKKLGKEGGIKRLNIHYRGVNQVLRFETLSSIWKKNNLNLSFVKRK